MNIVSTNTSYTSRRNQQTLQRQTTALQTENLVLRSLSPQTASLLAPHLRQVSLRKDKYLCQPEECYDAVYFPETAVVSEFKILEDGHMIEVAVIGREGALGASAAFGDENVSSNCAQVVQAGLAFSVETQTLQRLVRQNDELRLMLNQPVDQYIRQISQKVVCNVYHSVKERFCTWLLMLQDRCRRSQLSLTHEQIARVLGVYRPSITCIAQELREEQMIDYKRGGITIRDRKLVERTACACYSELADRISMNTSMAY
jgi:CRP-like cAMP-binding protein